MMETYSGLPPVDSPPESEHLDAATAGGPVHLRTPESLGLASWTNTVTGGPARIEVPAQSDWNANKSDFDRPATAVTPLPAVGADLCGFKLLSVLGQGAFGRVFLAKQGDLADREVVVKVSPSVEVESRILARLQHTNIVPVYSIHRSGTLQAVCMPYLGGTTLAHVMKELAGSPSLPQSGGALVGTVLNRRSTVGPDLPASDAAPAEAPLADAAPSNPTGPLEVLQALSYVDAVLWIGARLADGLAHAHERGIVHRDLKPANILITDDGQPMLLDFNLATDTERDAAALAHVGGTLPFMAPEQLEALRRDTPLVETAGDIYSIGVILFELLTGRHPFEDHPGGVRDVLPKMIEERRVGSPAVRRWNRAVTPAVEAIVRHCLEPDPARRYRTARDLKEDLERQLENLPLRHLPEPSTAERVGKWMRRHPKLASGTTACLVGAVIFALLGGTVVARGEALAAVEARAGLGRFQDERKAAQYLLTARTEDVGQLKAGVERGRAALEPYGVLDRADWKQAGSVTRLSAADKAALDEGVGELLLLLARGATLQAEGEGGPARDEALAEADRFTRLAAASLDGENAPRALLLQKAELSRLLGRADEAATLRGRAEATPLRGQSDRYLVAFELVTKGRHNDAVPLLTEATDRDPQDFWCWLLLGVCHDSLSRSGDAIACYSTCLALAPESPWASYNRGLANLRMHRYGPARIDFDRAIELRPTMAEAYTNRAAALIGLKKYDAAIGDLDTALEMGASPAYARFLRATAREQAGDAAGAKKDREGAMRLRPADEKDWMARGYARLATDPKAALADFEEALRINPRSLPALQNKAHLLGKAGKNKEAIAALDKAVELYPDFVPARAGRGVLRARLGQRAAAHEDGDECLARDRSPLVTYQLAGIYALTSRDEPADRGQAFRLLSSALQRGCGFDLLEKDKDLDPIRDCPEFKKLVDAARAIRADKH